MNARQDDSIFYWMTTDRQSKGSAIHILDYRMRSLSLDAGQKGLQGFGFFNERVEWFTTFALQLHHIIYIQFHGPFHLLETKEESHISKTIFHFLHGCSESFLHLPLLSCLSETWTCSNLEHFLCNPLALQQITLHSLHGFHDFLSLFSRFDGVCRCLWNTI